LLAAFSKAEAKANTLIIEDVRFLGCSIWTDFKLYGEGAPMFKAVEDAR
jgi:hypothetical protein